MVLEVGIATGNLLQQIVTLVKIAKLVFQVANLGLQTGVCPL